MGWIRALDARAIPDPVLGIKVSEKTASSRPSIEHIEDIAHLSLSSPAEPTYALQPSTIPDAELPLIPSSEIPELLAQHSGPSSPTARTWIVVDSVVVDATEFLENHPGGEDIILQFAGRQCGWQFWRFHSKGIWEEWVQGTQKHVEEGGKRGWRVARLEGNAVVKNRFPEPRKFVGLRKLGADWW
jgi:cytochrome b involved in lipid metabolism